MISYDHVKPTREELVRRRTVYIVAGLAVTALAVGIARGEFGWYIFALAMGLVALVGFATSASRTTNLPEWLRLHAIDFLECPKCRAPLDGLAESGDCPECQTHYDPEILRTTWLAAYPVPVMLASVDRAIEKRGLVQGRGPKRSKSLPSEGFACILILIIWLSLTVLSAVYGNQMFLSYFGGTLTGAFFPMLFAWRKSRGRARIIALDFRVCPRCNFDLRGLPSPGACPECRCRFSDRSLRVHWLLTMGIPAKTSLGLTKERWLSKHPEDRAVSADSP